MSEINPNPRDVESINAQRVFWVSVIYAFVAATSVGLAIFLITRFPIWQVYVMAAITVISLGFDVAAIILVRRGQLASAVKLLFWSGLVTTPLNVLIITNVTALLAPLVVVVGFVNVFYLSPRSWRKRYQFWPVVAAVLMFIVDYLDPSFRVNLGNASGPFGPIAVSFIVVSIIAIALMQAWRGSIRVKLTVPTAIAILIALGAYSFIIVQSTQNALTEQVGESFVSHSEDHGDQIANFFLENAGQLQVLALSDILRAAVEERNASYDGSVSEILDEIQYLDKDWIAAGDDDPLVVSVISEDPTINPSTDTLLDFLDTFSDHVEVFITDQYGATIAATGRLSDYYQADEEWWQAAWYGGEGSVYISDPEYDESADVTAMLAVVPITSHDTGEVIGVLRSTISANALADLVAEDSVGETGHVVLFDKLGEVVFDARAETVDSAGLAAELRWEVVSEGAHFDIAVDQQGSDILIGHAPVYGVLVDEGSESEMAILAAVNNLSWTALFRQDVDEALAIVNAQIRSMIVLTLVVIGLIIATLVGLAQLLVAPLLRLTDVAKEIADGDLSARALIETGDEIAALASTFNTMTTRLQETMGTLEQQVEDRTRALETSTEVSRRLSTILDRDRLVREVVEQLQSAFGYYHAHIYLFDDPRKSLVMVGGTGDAGRAMLAREHKIDPGKGLVGRAAQNNQVVLVPDVSKATGWLPNPLLPDTKAEVAVPIAIGDEVLGVLDVQHNLVDGLEERDANLIQAIANQVAIAVQNAQAYTRAQKRAERDARIVAINQRIQSAKTVDDVLKTAIRELGQVLGTRRSSAELKVDILSGDSQN